MYSATFNNLFSNTSNTFSNTSNISNSHPTHQPEFRDFLCMVENGFIRQSTSSQLHPASCPRPDSQLCGRRRRRTAAAACRCRPRHLHPLPSRCAPHRLGARALPLLPGGSLRATRAAARSERYHPRRHRGDICTRARWMWGGQHQSTSTLGRPGLRRGLDSSPANSSSPPLTHAQHWSAG
jgi:hypothetical protein